MDNRNENNRIIAEFMGWKSGRRCDGKMLTQAGTSWDFVCKECGTRIHRSRWLPAEARIGELPHDIPMPDYYAKGADWQAVRDKFVETTLIWSAPASLRPTISRFGARWPTSDASRARRARRGRPRRQIRAVRATAPATKCGVGVMATWDWMHSRVTHGANTPIGTRTEWADSEQTAVLDAIVKALTTKENK